MRFTTQTSLVSIGGVTYPIGAEFDLNEHERKHLESQGVVLDPVQDPTMLPAPPAGDDPKPTEPSIADRVAAMRSKAEVAALAASIGPTGIELKSTKLDDMKAELLLALEPAPPAGDDPKPTEPSTTSTPS